VANKDYRIKDENPGVCFGVMINEIDNGEGGYSIEILMNDQEADGRGQAIPFQQVAPYDDYIGTPSEDAVTLFTERGFAHLQNWMANFALRLHFDEEKNSKMPTISNLIVPMKMRDYYIDDFNQVLTLLSFFVFLTYIVPLYRVTYRIVNEKETRARESMKMMGLSDSSYWLSWISFYACIVTLISAIVVM
jgi:ATP-binding cassette subfamily A (ABC1) protein 3